MEAVFINTTRSGYSPEQCYDTLTVGELIKILSEFGEDQPVYLRNDDGYTYGHISARAVTNIDA